MAVGFLAPRPSCSSTWPWGAASSLRIWIRSGRCCARRLYCPSLRTEGPAGIACSGGARAPGRSRLADAGHRTARSRCHAANALGHNARRLALGRYTWAHHVAAILSGLERLGLWKLLRPAWSRSPSVLAGTMCATAALLVRGVSAAAPPRAAARRRRSFSFYVMTTASALPSSQFL